MMQRTGRAVFWPSLQRRMPTMIIVRHSNIAWINKLIHWTLLSGNFTVLCFPADGILEAN